MIVAMRRSMQKIIGGRGMKKKLALLLAVVMAVSLVPFAGASAATTNRVTMIPPVPEKTLFLKEYYQGTTLGPEPKVKFIHNAMVN